MKKTCLLIVLSGLLCGTVLAADVVVSADMSCRTYKTDPDTCKADSSKLSVRSDDSANKSWIRFDQLSGLDLSLVRGAKLRVANQETGRGGTVDVSGVNDGEANTTWNDNKSDPVNGLTWNNAPANDTASNTDPDWNEATLMDTIDIPAATTVAGDQYYFDVLGAIHADTDGIVQFVLHNSSGLIQIATHDHSGGEEYWPTLILTFPPAGADYPMPEIGETVTMALPELSWTNPDPNYVTGEITCTVYIGTDPNLATDPNVLLADDSKVLNPGEESVAINETNFPNVNPLQDNTTYYWFVDCYDSSLGVTIPGEPWTFNVYDNQPPEVNAGEDDVTWMTNDPNTIILSGTATDDGGTPTIEWSETSELGTAVITSSDQLTTLVSFTATGDYTFTLSADDGELPPVTDTVRIVVGDSPCDAAHVFYGTDYNEGDVNEDCLVDLADFMELIAEDWLNCTNQLTGC